MKSILPIAIPLVAAAAALLALAAGAVLAHEQREGELQWVVGFLHEPTYEGQVNGAYLQLFKESSDHDQAAADPVEDAHETLQVEVTHLSSGASKVLNLRPLVDAPGEYVAELIPTAPGAYQFRVFGTLDGEQVEETFMSEGAGGDFDDVRSSVDLQFPVQLPEIREIEGVVRGAQNTAAHAQDVAISADDSASSAGVLAIVGIALGVVGIVVGVGGVTLAMKRR